MNPIKFIEQNESIIIEENNYDGPKAEKIIHTIKSYLNILADYRNSKQLTRKAIEEIEKKSDPLELETILHWIYRSIKFDDSFVHAYNSLTQRDNRNTGIPFDLKEVNEVELLELLGYEESKVEPSKETYWLNKDESFLRQIFEACDDSFSCEFQIFLEGVKNADFTKLKINKKNIVQHLTYRLSYVMEKRWYTAICNKMEWEKSDCSGQNTKIGMSKIAKKINKLLPLPPKE